MRIKTKSTSEPIWPIRLSLLEFCYVSKKFGLGWSSKWSYENVFLFLNFSPFMNIIPALKFYYSLLYLYNKCLFWYLFEHKAGFCYFGPQYLSILSFLFIYINIIFENRIGPPSSPTFII